MLNLIVLSLLLIPTGDAFVLASLRRSEYSASSRLGHLFSNSDDVSATDVVVVDYKAPIAEALSILHRAVETKQEDPEKVYLALVDLEKLTRLKVKTEGTSVAEEILDSLSGAWQLVFTTGTAKSQASVGRINYIPIKAVQTFDTSNWEITNGIYIGDFAAIKFLGSFSFDLTKRKLEFDFSTFAILQLLDIPLKQGDAVQFADNSGLGQKAETSRKPFFNWISADAKIATARGCGGGLALWKRL